jgi:hypothetical protein
MLQAHALRSRGFTIEQIAKATNHAPSTVHGWLRDFELEREHIVAAIAQDQLLVLLHSQAELMSLNEQHPPQTAERADSRNRQLQALAALTRELRLVCSVLLRSRHDHVFRYDQPEDIELPVQDLDAVAPIAQLQNLLTDLLESPPQIEEQSESSRTEPNLAAQNERNLEISEHAQPQSPVHNGKSSKSVQNDAETASKQAVAKPSAAPSPRPPTTLPRPRRAERENTSGLHPPPGPRPA